MLFATLVVEGRDVVAALSPAADRYWLVEPVTPASPQLNPGVSQTPEEQGNWTTGPGRGWGWPAANRHDQPVTRPLSLISGRRSSSAHRP